MKMFVLSPLVILAGNPPFGPIEGSVAVADVPGVNVAKSIGVVAAFHQNSMY